MITPTTFKSVAIRARIMGAMRRAMVRKQPQAILNRKGRPFLTVEYVPYRITRCFKFTASSNTTSLFGAFILDDVTETVYQGLRS